MRKKLRQRIFRQARVSKQNFVRNDNVRYKEGSEAFEP